jgi:putative hemolysin
MVNISVNVAVQNVFSDQIGQGRWLYAIAMPLLLTVVFGEIVPKSIALCMNEKIAKFMTPVLVVLKYITMPLRCIFLYLAKLIMRGVFFKSKELVPDEKMFAIEKSLSLGLISETESSILSGAADLSQVRVKEVMRPKQEFVSWDIESSLEELVHIFSSLECSKIIVFKGAELLGVLSQESFFKKQDTITKSHEVQEILTSPIFVADTFNCKRVLEMMLSAQMKIVLVIDEYSSVIGLVTKEDLVESVVGQIHDKRDDKKLYTQQKDGAIICSGKLLIKDLEDLMATRIEHSFDCTTVGGLLTQMHGDIPKVGAKLKIQRLNFVVLGVNQKRVKSLHIFRS